MSDTIDTLEAQNRKSKIAQAMKEYSSEGSDEASARRAKTREAIASEPESMTTPDDEKARRKAKLLEMVPDSATTKQAIDFGDNAASITGLTPGFIANNADQVAKALYGPADNSGSAAPKLKAYLNNTELDAQINMIHGLHPLGPLPPEDQQKVDQLEKQKSGNTLQGIPKFAADVISGIGTYAVGIGQKIDYGAQNISENMQGTIAKGFQFLGVRMNPDTADYHFDMALQAARNFTAVSIGAAKRAARERGEGEVSSLITAEVLDLGNTLMLAFPAGRAKEAAEVAFAGAVAKTGLKGGVAAIKGSVAKQTTFAATVSAWNNLVEQMGVELSNAAEKTNVPLKSVQDQLKDMGMSTLTMAAGGLAMEGTSAIAGKLKGIAERTDKANAKPSPDEAGGAKVAPEGGKTGKPANPQQEAAMPLPPAEAAAAEAKAEASRVALAKQMAAATPIGELDKPIVPRGTPITGKEPFGKTPGERINDLATLEKNKVINPEQQAELDKLRSDQVKTPAIMDIVAKDRSVRGIRQLLAEDPTNPALNEALKFAEDQAAKDALEKQAVVNERVRVETVASRNKLIEGIHALDWSKMNKDLGDAVKAIQDKFEQKGHTLKADLGDEKVAELAQVHEALQAAGNGVSPELDLSRLKDLPTTKLRDLTINDTKTIHDALLNLDHINRWRGKVRDFAAAIEMSDLEKQPISRPHPNNPAWERTFRDVRSREHSITKSYDYLTEWISGGKNTKMHDVIGRNVVEGYVDSKAKALEYTAPFDEAMKTKHGIDEMDNNIKWVKFWNETFTENGVTMTREEIMHDYMNFQNENNKTSLLSPDGGEVIPSHRDEFGNNPGVEHISEETYLKLFSHIEGDKDLAQIAAKQMETQGNDRDQYQQDEYGFPMTREENYWPKYNVDVGQLDLKSIEEGKRYVPISPNESRQKARTGYHGPLYNYGFTHTLKQSANESAIITKMGPAARAAGAVLNNPVIKKSIVDAVGETTHRGLIKDLETMVGRRDTPSDLEHVLNSFGNVVSTAALGSLNTVKAPIKIGSLGLRSLARHPEVAIDTIRDIVGNYKNTSKEAYGISKRLQVAKRHGGTLDLKQMLSNEGAVSKATVVKAGLANVKRRTSALVRKASNFSYVMDTTVAANAVDHEFKRITDADSRASRAEELSKASPNDQKLKAQAEALRNKANNTNMSDDIASASHLTKEQVISGITPEQRSQAQGRYADQLIGETHATGDAPNMVGMQKSAVGRNIIGKFHVETYKAGEVLCRAFMEMKRNPSARNINTAVRLTVYYGLAEGAFIYGIDAAYNSLMNVMFGTKGTKKQQDKSAPKLGEVVTRDDIAKFPIAGETAQTAIDIAKYHTAQPGAVESYAQMPISTVLGIITLTNPSSTQKQRNTATQHVMYGVGHLLGIGILSDIYERTHQ